jgi:hypothetical protein
MISPSKIAILHHRHKMQQSFFHSGLGSGVCKAGTTLADRGGAGGVHGLGCKVKERMNLTTVSNGTDDISLELTAGINGSGGDMGQN